MLTDLGDVMLCQKNQKKNCRMGRGVVVMKLICSLGHCEYKFYTITYHLTTFKISSSSSIGTATLVGFGLLNYHWVFSAGRFLQSAFASGTSNPQPGGPVIRTFQFPPPRLKRHERTPAAEGGTMGEKIAENFAENGDFHLTFGFFYMP